MPCEGSKATNFILAIAIKNLVYKIQSWSYNIVKVGDSNMDHGKPSNVNKLYKSFESQLEVLAERLFTTKINDDENILGGVQLMIERIFIKAAMKVANSNVSKAAKLLGMSRNTLIRKLKAPG
jgi:transcriptional regulator of acetoin/glycerol metabolism